MRHRGERSLLGGGNREPPAHAKSQRPEYSRYQVLLTCLSGSERDSIDQTTADGYRTFAELKEQAGRDQL
jgi:hypothetical protein